MLNKYGFNVSRETNKKIIEYIKILKKWNNSINLISKSSEENIWERHVIDSAQIWPLLGETKFNKWVDLGSGAGFPGIVLSIIAKETSPLSKFILIEKDKRKSEFLNIISKKLDLNFVVYSDRIENLNSLNADIISARALSSLKNLLFYSKKHRTKEGISFFLKGQNILQEIKDIKESEDFSYTLHPSITSSTSYIIAIGRQNE